MLEGPLVGLGYLNEPERTAQSFIREPLWLQNGYTNQFPGRRGRLYKTGDLVRYDEHGNLSYIGRKDSMIKIRGQRVELGEVEYRIKECKPDVEQVVADVIIPQGEGSRPILVAFLQASEKPSEETFYEESNAATIYSATSDIRTHLSRHLPHFMVPSMFFSMKNLPKTATGKMDRRRMRAIGGQFSLQQLAEMKAVGQGLKRKPKTRAEIQIQMLWSQSLDIDATHIGLDDSFLQLGGDSIGAMKLVGEAQKIGLGLTVAGILGAPNLERLASEENSLSLFHDVSRFELLPNHDVSNTLEFISQSYGIDLESIEDVYPCTPLQQGIFMLSSSQGEYITQRVLALDPNIDKDCFCRTWKSIATKTELLRTRFVMDSRGTFLQLVSNEEVHFTEVGCLDAYLKADRSIAMSMGQPLARFALVRNSTGAYTHFILTAHHGIYDGWSLRLIIDAADAEYQNQSQGFQPKFNSFIKYINMQDKQEAEAYWRNYLKDYDGTVFPALPPTVAHSCIDSRLRSEFKPLKDKAQTATLSNLIRAAWALVMGRHLDSQDVVFGVPVSGRSAPVAGIDKMRAPTIATVPVRGRWEGNWTLADYLRTLQQQALAMIPFEQTGLHRIAKTCNESRNACRFQTLLLIQPHFPPIEETMGKWVVAEYQELNTYALTLEIKLAEDKITAYAGFDSRAIDSWVVKGLLEQLHSVLLQLSSMEPTKCVSDVNFITPGDLETIWTWNNSVPNSVERCVHEMIVERAEVSRELPAVCAWNGQLTYGELHQLSTALAWKLLDLGLHRGCLVPLCFEKSVWTIVTLLAVCKAGCAFVLLDPSLPEQRLHGIIRQLNPSIMLSSHACHYLSTRLLENVIVISSDFVHEMGTSPRGPLPQVNPKSTMYVVFTSGSTGTPKGTVIRHNNLASAISHQMQQYKYGNDSRVFDFASYSFDMAVFVVFHTLASGSCLCVPNEDERKSNLAKSINSLRADTLILTPSVTRALNPDEVPRIKSIMWIGEALNVGDVEPWWKKNVRLLNGYGPAECTPISTISADASTPEEVTNIGKGIGHTTWVVDPNDHDSLVPIGYVGELLLEGPLVGCGYLNDPDKTSAAFIKDPIWLLKGSKAYPGRHGYMYKTGDLVKYNEDGVLTYLGRKDAQVKIRGQRVELGEVEHHLKRVMPKINQVAVEVIFPDANAANSLLVAFVQMGESVIDSAIPKLLNLAPDVEQKLGECLPNYMLPALLVVIANLPMTATGKTDRKELKAIGQSFSAEQIAELRTSSHQSKRQPASHTEVRIQRIWSQVLNINTSKIGIDDSFIQLGGDSITAMQVSSLARAESMDISSTDILRVKTIAALATRLGDSLPLSHIVSSLHESSNTEPFQMSPMQNLHVQLQTDPAACYDQAFYLQLNKKVTQHDLSVALIHIIDRHSMLRARFSRTESGHWQQRISTDAEGSCSLQLWSSTNQDTPAAISQCRSLLNIYEGPLVSALLFDDDTQTLFISIHHLVVDFVSWRVILRELEELLISETISTPLSLNFRSWVDMQAKYSNENLKAKPPLLNRDSAVYLHYWGMEAKENLALGTVTETFAIDEAVTSAILGHCNTAFSTRPMELMIAALIYSFGVSFPARRDPLVLNEGHGREAWEDGIDISTTVGWFTTMLPIKISSGSVASLEDIILLTKDCVRSFSHNGWADFTSRYANSPEAAISAKGLPAEILFNYAGLYQQLERDGGLFGKLPLPSGCEPLSRQQVRRFSLFEIGARVENHRLSVSVAFHKDMSHQQEIRGWIQQYRLTIMQMSAELSQLEPTWTLSDFPGAFESYDELREFVNTQLKELSVKPSEVEDIFPCSPLQEGILASKTRDSRNYQARFTMRVKISEEKPSLDVGKLEQSWAAVTQKHSLLRSLVVKRRSKCQRSKIIVLKSPVPAFSCEKTQFASAITMSTTNDWVPLKQDELQYRLTIYHVNAREAYLRLDISHAIMDGFSMQILWDEFKASYSGTSVPSGDFKNVVNHLQKHPEDAGFQFWKRYLENVKPCLAPPSVSIGAKFVEFKNVDVPIRQYLNMKDFCQKCDVTAATLIQVAWAIVLGHLTGATTPCFGNVYSGRDLPIANVNKTFGPLIGMAPCRVVLDGNKSVLNVLEAAQSEYLDSLPHQHFPLKRIHEALCLGSSALFNTIISFQRSPDEEERPHDTFSLHCLDIFDPNEVRLHSIDY
jgi:amino acid adenylation domain-containing protein